MKAKVLSFRFLITILIVISSFFIGLFIYDPLQVFHKHFKVENTDKLSGAMRKQSAGIINNYDFDSIILGTSMLENTSSKEASNLIGGKFINLSMSGGMFNERSIVLNYALKKKKIKNIIFSLDNAGLVLPKRRETNNYNFLYDSNYFNDFKVYLNDKYLKCFSSFSMERVCLGRTRNIDRPNAWHMKTKIKKRLGGLENWFKSSKDKQVIESFTEIIEISNRIKNKQISKGKDFVKSTQDLREYFNKNILIHIIENPQTKFILVLPPYSLIKFSMMAQYYKNQFELYKYMIKYITLQSEVYNNLELYGWGNHDFIDNIAYYKDLRHYSEVINSRMLKDISKQTSLITIENLNTYLNRFEIKALNYNLVKLGVDINERWKYDKN